MSYYFCARDGCKNRGELRLGGWGWHMVKRMRKPYSPEPEPEPVYLCSPNCIAIWAIQENGNSIQLRND